MLVLDVDTAGPACCVLHQLIERELIRLAFRRLFVNAIDSINAGSLGEAAADLHALIEALRKARFCESVNLVSTY